MMMRCQTAADKKRKASEVREAVRTYAKLGTNPRVIAEILDISQKEVNALLGEMLSKTRLEALKKYYNEKDRG